MSVTSSEVRQNHTRSHAPLELLSEIWKFLYKVHHSVATKVLVPELSNFVRSTVPLLHPLYVICFLGHMILSVSVAVLHIWVSLIYKRQ